MPNNPKVSICIPTYNQTVYLNILLASIANQTFTDYEIVVSDDSTTPDVEHLVSQFKFGDKLRYYRNTPSLGSPANWNAAIAKASGAYIKLMHHDDAFARDSALLEMITAVTKSKAGFAFCDSMIENATDSRLNRTHHIRAFEKLRAKPYMLFFGNSIGSPSALILNGSLAGRLAYDPTLIWLVDIEYYTRLLRADHTGIHIGESLIITHDAVEHRLTSSILKDTDLQIKEQIILYNKLSRSAGAVTRFFMQVYFTRLLFKFDINKPELSDLFAQRPSMIRVYFATRRSFVVRSLYRLFIVSADVGRKFMFGQF